MTTKVHVICGGPQPIEVHVMDREDGKFQAGEKATIHPGDAKEFYVYDSQSLQVLEKKD